MRPMACFGVKNFHSRASASRKRKRTCLVSTGKPLSKTSSNRTGRIPIKGRFVSKRSWFSSSVRRGAIRTDTPPALAVFTFPASGGNSTAGFTLKSEPAQEVLRKAVAITNTASRNLTFHKKFWLNIARNLSRRSKDCQLENSDHFGVFLISAQNLS